jgi:phosphomethylpyrimidine synthase
VRRKILDGLELPFGTVPIYQAVLEAGCIEKISVDDLLGVVELHAKDGVDFMTIHAGILKGHLPLVEERLTKIVSRGGAILAEWMLRSGRENPFYENFDRLCEIFKKYDVSFSLGDALRPGSLADASDRAQFAELETLGGLVKQARQRGVQVMVEGPGHLPMDQIQFNIEQAKKICDGAPFYVLGPVVTDVGAGYDHVASAIGAAIAGWFGADLLCYVTPREHLGLPDVSDVKEGVIAYKIAAHAADLARGQKGARRWDDEFSRARAVLDWDGQFKLSLDPELAKRMYLEGFASLAEKSEVCSMCGPKFCPINLSRRDFAKKDDM